MLITLTGDGQLRALRRATGPVRLDLAVTASLSQDADDIRDVLKAVALVKSAPKRSRDVVAGYGEIWSARLLAAYLGQESPHRGDTWILQQ